MSQTPCKIAMTKKIERLPVGQDTALESYTKIGEQLIDRLS